jgi:protein PsiE
MSLMDDETILKRAAIGRMRKTIDPIGHFLAEGFHLLGLFAIGGATVWAAAKAFLEMSNKGHASIEDLLLLFIYLEIGSMVGIYFKTNHMPVRFLLYVGITALTRHMIGYVQKEATPDLGILILAGGTLILALAVFIIRYASFHYSTGEQIESSRLSSPRD